MLSLMQHAEEQSGDARGGYTQLLELVERSHTTAAERDKLKVGALTVLESLEHAGVVGHDGDALVLDPNLQRDFSLNHSLSLFLLDALASVDLASEKHALDVLSWVEAILENPRAVLERQVDREKTRIINELRAAGVPYEDRIAAIEDISYPKPNSDVIYPIFNAYAEKHPWVAGEGIRPKGIVREMVEIQISFGDYVNELGLQRMEGVLLRYVSDVYKAMVQNVPPEHQTEGVADIIGYLRAMLGMVDSSLLTEWEKLLHGEDANQAPRAVDISEDKKVFFARIRAELHAMARALANRDWEEAAACTKGNTWGPEDFERAIAPFIAETGGVRFDHAARLGSYTRIAPNGAHRWDVRQVLLPLEGEEEDIGAWAITGRVDLRENTNPEGPLIEVLAVGE
jgi:hypothetical protein